MNENKTAIVVLSDPKAGGEEALGRVFNALAVAYDYHHAGAEVTLLFQGTGTRWLGELTRTDHPAHKLFKSVEATVAGASCGCAEAFGAEESVQQTGFDLIKNNPVPETGGLPSLRKLREEGYAVLTF